MKVAVTGIADVKRCYIVKATVVLSKGYTSGDEPMLDLLNLVKSNTPPYKYSRMIKFVDSLQKTIRVELNEITSYKKTLITCI